ncbi:MAG: tetratricopeptide repeat protein, partial [Gemmatimonadales bacterium]
ALAGAAAAGCGVLQASLRSGVSMIRRSIALLAIAFAVTAGHINAQDPALVRAFRLERAGNDSAAADAYRQILSNTPDDVAALLGLERVLTSRDSLELIIPAVQAALAGSPRTGAIYSLGIRAWSAAGEPDSVRSVVERWVAIQPNDESPWREWAMQALARRDRQEARRILGLAREHLNRPTALAGEMAQLAMSEGDYLAAVNEWISATAAFPGYRNSAVNALAVVPIAARKEVTTQLVNDGSGSALAIGALLQIRWADPPAAWRLAEQAITGDSAEAMELLANLLEALQSVPGRDAREIEGHVLSAVADRSGGAEATEYRLEAARAYAAAGDSEAARRLLSRAETGVADSQQLNSEAGATLISVLLDEGRLEEAETELIRFSESLPGALAQELSRKIAAAWILKGNLDRADSLVSADSTVDGLALRGRLRLYRGELAEASSLFQSAGPFAGTRDQVTDRTILLALLQSVRTESDPDLGRAFLTLARGDTASAVESFRDVAGRLPITEGGAEVLLLAGRLAAGSGQPGLAEPMLRQAAESDSTSAAPAALLELARVMVAQQRPEEAIPLLERLILQHARSAAVPQARRLLDELNGAVPKT